MEWREKGSEQTNVKRDLIPLGLRFWGSLWPGKLIATFSRSSKIPTTTISSASKHTKKRLCFLIAATKKQRKPIESWRVICFLICLEFHFSSRRKQDEKKIDWMYWAGRMINYLEQNRFIADRFISFLSIAFCLEAKCHDMWWRRKMEGEFMISSMAINRFFFTMLRNLQFVILQ